MPLARIITRTPQDAVGASEYLRSLGYTVETVSPEEFRVTPAELELNLDRCGAAEAVERALALVESGAAVAAEIEALPAPEPAPPQKAKIPIAYDITGQPVEFADEEEIESRPKDVGVRRALAAVATWLGRPWNDFRQRRAEQRALKLEAEAARRQQEVRQKEELARERLRQEIRRQREAAEQQAQQQEQARAAALHEAMIAGSEAAAAPEQPPVPETAPAVAAEAAGDNLTVLPAPAEAAPQQPQLPRRPQRPVQPRRRRAPIAISRAAVATACGLSLLLIMGFVAYANRRPASPFLPGVLTNVKQDVPFGAATITPSPVVSQHNPAGRRPAAMRPANRKPSAAQLGVRRSSRDNSQDEVVVRRLQPQPQPSTAKLKRHSDLD